MNLQENIHRIKQVMGVVNEGLHDTSWENDEGNKITLMDLLDSTEDIPVSNISVEELKPHLLSWDGDEDEDGDGNGDGKREGGDKRRKEHRSC